MKSWNVHTHDGRLLGSFGARNAEVALAICLALQGINVPPNLMKAKEISEDVCEITFGGEVYTLTAFYHA